MPDTPRYRVVRARCDLGCCAGTIYLHDTRSGRVRALTNTRYARDCRDDLNSGQRQFHEFGWRKTDDRMQIEQGTEVT